jgi:small subunit ribosomal protein S16
MLKIKLAPRGKIHQITYRIVIAEDRSKLNGPIIDDLGFYTPQTKALEINKEKLIDWQKKGAKLTEGVDKLLNPDKYPKKIKEKAPKEVKAEKPAEEIIEDVKTEEVVEETPIEETKTEEIVEDIKTEEVIEEVKTEETQA